MEYLYRQQGARRLYAYVEEDNFRSHKLCHSVYANSSLSLLILT
nr:hypothetical protein [Paenibacillus yonginensis]